MENEEAPEEDALLIQSLIKLVATLAVGAEELLGENASRLIARSIAGRIYQRLGLDAEPDVGGAFHKINSQTVLRLNLHSEDGKIVWEENGSKAAYLVAYECPVRQILYQEALEPGGVLCKAVCGLISNIFSKSGGAYRAELARYGPNACLIRVELGGPMPIESLSSERPSLEFYTERLKSCYAVMLAGIVDALTSLAGSVPVLGYRAAKRYGFRDGLFLLNEVGEHVGLEEAVSLISEKMSALYGLHVEDDSVVVEKSMLVEAASAAGLTGSGLVHGVVRGHLAGLLSVLTGERLDLASTPGDLSRLRVVARG